MCSWRCVSPVSSYSSILISPLGPHFLIRSQTWSSHGLEEARLGQTDNSKPGAHGNEGISHVWTQGPQLPWWGPATSTYGGCTLSFCSREVVSSYGSCHRSPLTCHLSILEIAGCRNFTLGIKRLMFWAWSMDGILAARSGLGLGTNLTACIGLCSVSREVAEQ